MKTAKMKTKEMAEKKKHSGVTQEAKEWQAKLLKSLMCCAVCSPEKVCKITKTGEHKPLTFGQQRGWCMALVSVVFSEGLFCTLMGCVRLLVQMV